MKISDYKDEKALDVLANIIEPVTMMLGDDVVQQAWKAGKPKITIVKMVLKRHKKELVETLAALHDTPVEEYHFTLMSLIADTLDLLNDKELTVFFSAQGQKTEETSSGSATASTTAEEA